VSNVQLYCGDSLDVLPTLEAGMIRMAFADPPYNNGTAYNSYEDQRPDYQEWCEQWFRECRRIAQRVVITPGHGNLWMWGKIEKPWGIGCWYKPGNPANSVLGWVTWEPWLYYTTDYRALGGPDSIRATVSKQAGVGDHPCPKPLDLLIGLVKKVTKPGDVVLDPFMGSGTTGVACILTGRGFVGIELDEGYYNIAESRIETAQREMIQARMEL